MAVDMKLKPGMQEWIQQRVDPLNLPNNEDRERNLKFLRGEGTLTVGQVRELSRRIQIPFGYFFLDTPPQETLPILQYRTVANAHVENPSRNLIDTISFARIIQGCVQNSREEQEYPILGFVGSEQSNAQDFRVEETAANVRRVLGLSDTWNTRAKKKDSVLRKLREVAQDTGIVVVLDKYVRHDKTRPLDVNEFRAFCFSDSIAPLIFVNRNDTVGAQLFSLCTKSFIYL